MPGVSNIIDICKDEYRKGYKDGYKDSDSRIPDLIRDIHDCVAEEMYEKGIDDLKKVITEYLKSKRMTTIDEIMYQLDYWSAKLKEQKNE